MKYFLYARKSSESEDRQMASIEDQIAEMKRLAEEQHLTVVDVIAEAKSAKAPGRFAFNTMLRRIEQGEAKGILCWKLNRLARNPVDGGQISWMLQQNIIEHIQTYGKDYKPSDNVLMMQVEFGMANQYIIDLSMDVRRGLRRKAERGWYPCRHLPPGYLHNPAEIKEDLKEEIIPDETRFLVIQKLWKLMMTGKYSIASIKREGDKRGLYNQRGQYYSHNTYHNLFTNKFYCGKFEWKDDEGVIQEYIGKHRRMVSEEEFNKVQYQLSFYRNPTRLSSYFFPYRGILQCGECKGHITAERQFQAICTQCKFKFSIKTKKECPRCKLSLTQMEKPSKIDITYYHCTKNRGNCSQGSITSSQIEEDIARELKKVAINREYCEWALKALEQLNDEPPNESKNTMQLKKRETELSKRINGLIHMRSGNEITYEQFNRTKSETEKELLFVQNELNSIETIGEGWKSRAKSYFNLALTSPVEFRKATDDKKKRTASKLALNLIVRDKKLYVSTRKVLLRIKDGYCSYQAETSSFEPKKTLDKYSLNGCFSPPISAVRGKLKSSRTCQRGNNTVRTIQYSKRFLKHLELIRAAVIEEGNQEREKKSDELPWYSLS